MLVALSKNRVPNQNIDTSSDNKPYYRTASGIYMYVQSWQLNKFHEDAAAFDKYPNKLSYPLPHEKYLVAYIPNVVVVEFG